MMSVLLVALGLGACSSTQLRPLGSQSATALRGKSVVTAAPATPHDFTAFTPGKAVLGWLGEQAMRSEGNRIVIENGIADPAQAVARELSEALAVAIGVKPLAGAASIASDERAPSVLSAKAGGAGLVLYVQTLDWRTWYHVTNFNRHRARLEMSADLIDTSTQAVVARAKCEQESPASVDVSPTYDEMVGAGAQRLKKELAQAQAACVLSLQQSLLEG
jgi:hypothetical protein